MTRTQISLSTIEHRSLKREAADQGISMAELVRRLVRDHLRKKSMRKRFKKKDFLAIVGVGESGEKEVSVRHDEHLGRH